MKYKCIAWIRIVIFSVVWLFLYFLIFIKLPFYLYIDNIALPEGCTQLETKVISTDYETWQIKAQRLIYSNRKEEEIKDYIEKNNKFSKYIEVKNLFDSNRLDFEYERDILIPSEKYYDKKEDTNNYILLSYSTYYPARHKGEHDLLMVMVLIGFVVMLVTCILIYKVSTNKIRIRKQNVE